MLCRKPWLVWVAVEDPREPEGKQAVGWGGGATTSSLANLGLAASFAVKQPEVPL
jgi:hypothetical protein